MRWQIIESLLCLNSRVLIVVDRASTRNKLGNLFGTDSNGNRRFNNGTLLLIRAASNEFGLENLRGLELTSLFYERSVYDAKAVGLFNSLLRIKSYKRAYPMDYEQMCEEAELLQCIKQLI